MLSGFLETKTSYPRYLELEELVYPRMSACAKSCALTSGLGDLGILSAFLSAPYKLSIRTNGKLCAGVLSNR